MTEPSPPVPETLLETGHVLETVLDTKSPNLTPSPFSRALPRFQNSWDSTSLGWFKRCPRYYQYSMLEGWSARNKSIHLTFGGLYASGVERYAHARASGSSHSAAQLIMTRWVLENSGDRDAETGEWIAWSPGDHPDANIKNRYTLLRSLIWNTEDRQDSPYKTVILANGRPAVELSFNFKVFDVAGEAISLSGHMDEVCEANGEAYIKDDKTTKAPLDAYFARSWTPNNQMTLYTLAGKVILGRPVKGVLVRAAQIGVNFTRFRTMQVPRPQSVLDEWLDHTRRWVALAHTYATDDHWPMNDTACTMYGGCVFQKVCSVSPTHRRAWLEEDFERRHWNPLQSRGDVS